MASQIHVVPNPIGLDRHGIRISARTHGPEQCDPHATVVRRGLSDAVAECDRNRRMGIGDAKHGHSQISLQDHVVAENRRCRKLGPAHCGAHHAARCQRELDQIPADHGDHPSVDSFGTNLPAQSGVMELNSDRWVTPSALLSEHSRLAEHRDSTPV